MTLEPLSINGAFLIRTGVFKDNRGVFIKPYVKSAMNSNHLRADFVEQYYTYSKPGVIRGMHFQTPPYEHAKLVYCVSGKVEDVLLDLRRGANYGRHISLTLSADVGEALYLPEGVAHGFATVSESALLVYNVTCEHKQEYDHGVRWNSFGHNWHVASPNVSTRDAKLPLFSDFSSPF